MAPSQPKGSKAASKTLTFDEAGDLCLTVGASKQDMIVDSRALHRASPAFRRMLSDDFAEGKPKTGEWHVKLPEDDPKAFAILMDMIHGLYRQTPLSPTLDELHRITVLADKYDMAQALRSMAFGWLGTNGPIKGAKSMSDRAKVLSIAWVLGHATTFHGVVQEIAEECKVDQEGCLIDDSGSPLKNYAEIDQLNVLDAINEMRNHKLQVLRDECTEFSKAMLSDTSPKVYKGSGLHSQHFVPKKGSSHEACHISLVGRMTQLAYSKGVLGLLLPGCSYPNPTQSLSDLKQIFSEIQLGLSSGSLCNPFPKLIDAITLAWSKPLNVLSLQQQKYLEKQNGKSNINVAWAGQ
ncbi:Fc.00g067560.m01.CDS01 [Cosmosporella sp. VM-42]